MIQILELRSGLGLAANQIGFATRLGRAALLVLDVEARRHDVRVRSQVHGWRASSDLHGLSFFPNELM